MVIESPYTSRWKASSPLLASVTEQRADLTGKASVESFCSRTRIALYARLVFHDEVATLHSAVLQAQEGNAVRETSKNKLMAGRTVFFAFPPRAMVMPVRMADLPEPLTPTRKLTWGPKSTVVWAWHCTSEGSREGGRRERRDTGSP